MENTYAKKFKDLLGDPSSEENLNEYIDFVLSNTISEKTNEYYEDHHIIPSCILKNTDTYTLTYINHIEAHVLLTKAYPISKFLRPLNFMLSREEKQSKEYRELLSYTIKQNWKEFKNTPQYILWKDKRSKACSKHMVEGHAKYMSDKGNTLDLRKQKSDAMKLYWTDDRKVEKSKAMIEYNKLNGTKRYSDALKKRYATMTTEQYDKFIDTMTSVNRDTEKRNKAGIKIKQKWQEPEYIKKMKNRKTGSNSSKMKEKWADPVWKANMLEKRRNKNNETN